MTASRVQLVTGVIVQAWSTSTTADVRLGSFAQANLGPFSAGQDVGELPQGLEVGVTVIYVPAASTVPMLPSTCREYLVMLGITVRWVRHCSNFAREEHIALEQLPRPDLAQV